MLHQLVAQVAAQSKSFELSKIYVLKLKIKLLTELSTVLV